MSPHLEILTTARGLSRDMKKGSGMSDELVKRLQSGNTNHVDADIWMSEAAARISALEDALAKADELAGAVDHERNMVCQDFGMQQKCAETVDSTLTAYRQARDATR